MTGDIKGKAGSAIGPDTGYSAPISFLDAALLTVD
jgi:hypothetical protein